MQCKDCTYYISEVEEDKSHVVTWKHDPDKEYAICALRELFTDVRADTPACADFVEE